ncbi:peptidoglycan-binding protein [Coraliomargarita sinensis]|uniref:Peptidoglycan-binding protein n=1 Tax=Coraliomargarita sinensis TaxID=2174842 RepID=A0A317ZKH4_9BACT|nr:LysM peptidoglycan-binding domain-containing protein [Coraliomargarita sinensis]PXA04723.1 peptidoglycan-binding protein [Coraliomargarita sinensis]
MMRRLYFAMSLSLGALVTSPSLFAQSDSLRVTVANLSQDVSQMEQQVKTLRLEIEQMHRLNKQLRAQLAAATSSNQTNAQISSLSTAIDAVRREYKAADASQKEQILAEMNRQMEVLAKETQKAVNTVAEAVGSEPQVSTPVHFSSDYPKTGITYTVRSGDTLSKIAREHGSNIKHIQNANKIVNPARDLQVGQTIFIPIAQ